MVQRLPDGRKTIKRVKKKVVEDVCLIARNAIDRINDLERLTYIHNDSKRKINAAIRAEREACAEL